MALIDEIEIASVWVSSSLRFSNGTGTPITSVAQTTTGEMIADDYAITFSSVGGGTGTATVATSSPNNPYNGRVVTGVPLDGATIVKNVVPGVGIVFNAATANGNIGTVNAGAYLGVFDSEGVEAGTPSTGVQHRVTNDGSGAVSAAIATLLTQAIMVKKTGTVMAYVKPYADGATEKVVGGGSTKTIPYQLKVIAVSGSGSSKVATLQLNTGTSGSPVWTTYAANTIDDLVAGGTVSGTGLKAVSPENGYRINSGPLMGLEFAISSLCTTNDTCNVLIFPSTFIQISVDDVDGHYGPSDVVLTQSGQSAGIIQPAGTAFYYSRVLVPIGGRSESNPYPLDVVLEASETESAGWGD